MPAAFKGKPGRPVDGVSSVRVTSAAVSARAVALIGQAFDVIERDGDCVAALVAAYKADPLAYLERVHKLTAPAVEQAGKAAGLGGLVANINHLHLAALQETRSLGPPVIEHEPGTIGVEPALDDW